MEASSACSESCCPQRSPPPSHSTLALRVTQLPVLVVPYKPLWLNLEYTTSRFPTRNCRALQTVPTPTQPTATLSATLIITTIATLRMLVPQLLMQYAWPTVDEQMAGQVPSCFPASMTPPWAAVCWGPTPSGTHPQSTSSQGLAALLLTLPSCGLLCAQLRYVQPHTPHTQ